MADRVKPDLDINIKIGASGGWPCLVMVTVKRHTEADRAMSAALASGEKVQVGVPGRRFHGRIASVATEAGDAVYTIEAGELS